MAFQMRPLPPDRLSPDPMRSLKIEEKPSEK